MARKDHKTIINKYPALKTLTAQNEWKCSWIRFGRYSFKK